MASYYSVDRIENGVAACETEDRAMIMIPLSLLPESVEEGDVLYGHNGTYTVDKSETLRRREENIRLMRMLGLRRDTEDEAELADL